MIENKTKGFLCSPAPKYGDRIETSAKLVRISQRKSQGVGFRYWERSPHSAKGIFLGFRTVQNGETGYDEDSGSWFFAKDYFRVALVSPGENLNPIYVPCDAISCLNNADDITTSFEKYKGMYSACHHSSYMRFLRSKEMERLSDKRKKGNAALLAITKKMAAYNWFRIKPIEKWPDLFPEFNIAALGEQALRIESKDIAIFVGGEEKEMSAIAEKHGAERLHYFLNVVFDGYLRDKIAL